MKIHEYQAKELLAAAGASVAAGTVLEDALVAPGVGTVPGRANVA